MKPSETLRMLSKMMAALREHAPAGEITYQCGTWKMCDSISKDGSVRNFYKYEGEPENLFHLFVTLFCLGRAYTVKIESPIEACHA